MMQHESENTMGEVASGGVRESGGRDRAIVGVRLIVGMELHVELATRRKMFAAAPSPAHRAYAEASPNTLIDATVLALPGSLPVMNKAAVEMAVRVGLALNCAIAERSRWDRKGYFYPDLPKAYQISQYDRPLCGEGFVELPAFDASGEPVFGEGAVGVAAGGVVGGGASRVRIERAHLEEDAGKLMHEAPAGGEVDGSIVDYNRAGTPLLEIVTRPDITSAAQAVLLARTVRNICRFLRVSDCVMQKGQIRFEPNINVVLTLADGREVRTPIVEVKNLNSFKSLKGAIEFELMEQPRRWVMDGREAGEGTKVTRGWDDVKGQTFVQREKEEAKDYRYFPDPDLPPVVMDEAWRERIRGTVAMLPLERMRMYMEQWGLSAKEAAALLEEPETSDFFEACVKAAVAQGAAEARAGRLAATVLLQSGLKRMNEKAVAGLHALGIAPEQVAGLIALREEGAISAQAMDELFNVLCDGVMGKAEGGVDGAAVDVRALAQERGLLMVRDAGALAGWVDQVIAANPDAVANIRAGRVQAIGRLVGDVMKLAGGKADAKGARGLILERLGLPPE